MKGKLGEACYKGHVQKGNGVKGIKVMLCLYLGRETSLFGGQLLSNMVLSDASFLVRC